MGTPIDGFALVAPEASVAFVVVGARIAVGLLGVHVGELSAEGATPSLVAAASASTPLADHDAFVHAGLFIPHGDEAT